MSRLILCDPVGEVSVTAKRSAPIGWAPGKRVATLFNNHVSSYRVWKRLETLLAGHLPGGLAGTFAKENTFAPAPGDLIQDVVATADLAIVGVGA